MRKHFTLIEMIVVIVTLGILAAIVVANVGDFKKDSIKSALNGNIRNLQTAVDMYSLKNNDELPVKNKVTLTSPQYIDIDQLYPKYIKSKLDYKNIKSQYYWVDSYGKVWGSTVDAPLYATESENTIEWSVPKEATGYALYEVQGNTLQGAAVKTDKIKLVNYRQLPKATSKVQIPIENKDKLYLISSLDSFGLESAPVGLNYGGKEQFSPIFKGNGDYEFELSNLEDMYWEKFWTVEDKPDGTSIEYQFSVLDKDGKYGEWQNDFYQLPPSKGLKVKISMKAFENKYPSIYDIRVMYHYKDDPKPLFPSIKMNPPAGGWENSGETPFPTGSIGSGGGISTPPTDPTQTGGGAGETGSPLVCGTGGSVTNIDSRGTILNGDTEAYLTYSFQVPKGQFVDKFMIPNADVDFDHYVKGMWFEYSKNQSPYVKATSLSTIPDESCVKVVYNLMKVDSFVFPPMLFPPTITTTPKEPVVFVDPPEKWNKPVESGPIQPVTPKGGVPTKPEPTDTEVLNSQWETVQTLRFFAHSGDGQITHWVSATMNDIKPANTRIVYRYATSNGYFWSAQSDSISKVADSRSLVVIAYLQVDKDYLNVPTQEQPKVNSIKITHERGVVDLDSVKPTVAIMPIKDNNAGRDVISDTSNIEWTYEAADPRGLDIVETEWAGDKRDKYPAGVYQVQLRVRNSSNYWSDWVTYKFEVKAEKPVAVIDAGVNYFEVNTPINWSAAKSFDPDGDGISKVEWSDTMKSSYSQTGDYIVKLRVADNEGNWSEWTPKTISVFNKSYAIYKMEAEDSKFVTPANWASVKDCADCSNGKVLNLTGNTRYSGAYGVASFNFTGTGFDIKFKGVNNTTLKIDGKVVETLKNVTSDYTHSVRGLTYGSHSIVLTSGALTGDFADIDYIDIQSFVSNSSVLKIENYAIENGIQSPTQQNIVFPNTNVSVKSYYTLNENGYVTVTVTDSNDNVVKTFKSNVLETGGTNGTHTIQWDGLNEDKQAVPTGSYQLNVSVKSLDGKNTNKQSSTILVDSSKPFVVYEAEDSTKVSATGWKGIRDDATASGLKVLYLTGESSRSGAYGTMTVTFTGTGATIKFKSVNNSTVYVDYKAVDTLKNITSDYTYNIRNLPSGSHTIQVKTGGNTADKAYIDYIELYN